MATKAPLPQKILLFGATGVIGKYILQALLESNANFPKIGIFTSAGSEQKNRDNFDALKRKGIDLIVGDVHNEKDVKDALWNKDYDTVISALGRNVILTQISLLDIAEASSSTIKHFYPSEYGTDIEYFPNSASEKPHQLKLQVRDHIRRNIRKLNVTYLVTGPYSDLYLGRFPNPKGGSFDVKAKKATLLGTGEEKVSFTTMRDVGRLLVAALKTPMDASPRTLKVNSFTTTSKQILAQFEKQTGAKWEVGYTPMEELKELEKGAWERGDAYATPLTLRRIWTEGGTLYEKRDNWKIGEPEMESLEEQVREAVERQNAEA